MKRVIKFRAWHKELEDMTFSDEDVTGFWYKVKNYSEMYNIMQFTGLTDKHGKDIYEGDILKLANGEIITVEFKHGRFLGIRKNGTNSLTTFYWIHSEITGNIHQI